jgi:hypothetical protein
VARPAPRTGGGIYSTVRDLAQWVKLQLAEGAWGGRPLLKPETIREMHALHFSVPAFSRQPDNVYAAQFYGSGLGWHIQEYRGRKIVLHSGAWGAMVALIPEENLGVAVLTNLDNESLAGLLMYDAFDAYLIGPASTWDTSKWARTWLRNEPPGYAFGPRDAAKAKLEQSRTAGTRPALPLERYAGTYESPLYGPLVVRAGGGRLLVTCGAFTTELTHWQNESFYARAPLRLTYDWLITFAPPEGGRVKSLTVKYIGWDDEADQRFERTH